MESLAAHRSLVDERLETALDGVEPPELAEEVRHVSLSGGKRVRPTVTVLVCEAAGGQAADAIEYAVGIELVHSASLVVDDIIDESEVRRGVTSAWVEFGYGPAILASDGLLGEAFALFADSKPAMRTVAEAMVDLGQGEATELLTTPTSEAEYLDLARQKTGALFRAAAEVGAIAADADERTVSAFGDYAQRVGIAFQIRDDVLDATAEADALGKPTGQDAAMDRPSLVEVTDLTPAEADQRAHEHTDAALEALVAADVAETEAISYLRDLARFVVSRDR